MYKRVCVYKYMGIYIPIFHINSKILPSGCHTYKIQMQSGECFSFVVYGMLLLWEDDLNNV